jgi:hypothetical protein
MSELGNLTYQDIDNLEANLANPQIRDGYLFHETIIRLLCQTLRNNRFLADKIQNCVTESRMAWNISVESKDMAEKTKADMKFLLNIGKEKLTQSKDKGVPNARA